MNKREFKVFKEKLIVSAKNNLESGRVNWKAVVDDLYPDYPDENLNRQRLESLYRRNKKKPQFKDITNRQRADQAKLPSFRRKGGNLEASVNGLRENPANFSDEELAKLFDVDLKEWVPYDIKTSSWNQTLKDSENLPYQVINYSAQVKFKKNREVFVDEEVLKEIFEDALHLSNKAFGNMPKRQALTKETGNTLITGVFDAHIGKLAWRQETGENYDLKIASRRFLTAVRNIVDKANSLGVDKIIFPVGNDFFQYDNDESKTTKGTQVDTDIRWQKLFQRGVALLRAAIDYCATFATVDVIWVPGNHDFKTSFYAFETLRGWYYPDDRVTIDEDIKSRTYRLIGPNLLGFTHGDKERKTSLHALMSNEVPELWGQSKYREWVVGHFHKGDLYEDMGVTVRVLGSITGTDAWHYQKGFIGSLRAAQGLIFNCNSLGPHIIIYDSVDITVEKGQD